MCNHDKNLGLAIFMQGLLTRKHSNMYEYFFSMPEKKIFPDLDARFRQILTTNCYFPKELKVSESCHEFVILDTEEREVVFYTLSQNEFKGSRINTWRHSDSYYDNYISDIGYRYIKTSLLKTPVILDSHLSVDGTHYWQGIVFSIMSEEPTARLSRWDGKFSDVEHPFSLKNDFLNVNNIQYILCIE